MGKSPSHRPNSRPGQTPTRDGLDDYERPWAGIDTPQRIRPRGRGDLLDIDPDLCDDLEARPEDAGGMQPGQQ
jgi:hypothetical protein